MRYKNINGKRKIYRVKHKMLDTFIFPKNVELFDDAYLVSYPDSYLVVAQRASGNRIPLLTKFLDLLDVRERAILNEYLYAWEERPLVLRTDVGTAVIDKSMTPSTLLFIASFFREEEDGELLELILQSGVKDLYVPDIYSSQQRSVKLRKSVLNDVSAVMNSINDCFANTKIYEFNPPRINVKKFNRAVRVMSDYSGCAVDLRCERDLICDGRFDAPMFNSYLFSLLSLARRLSPERRATVELSSSFLEGISARVIIEAEGLAHAFTYPEIVIFFNLAERHNMLFEAEKRNGKLTVRFCPNRKDWSYIGIKDSVIEEYCIANGGGGRLPWLLDAVTEDE